MHKTSYEYLFYSNQQKITTPLKYVFCLQIQSAILTESVWPIAIFKHFFQDILMIKCMKHLSHWIFMQIIFFLLIALNSKLEIFHGIGGFLHPRGAISNTIALCELPHFLHFITLSSSLVALWWVIATQHLWSSAQLEKSDFASWNLIYQHSC